MFSIDKLQRQLMANGCFVDLKENKKALVKTAFKHKLKHVASLFLMDFKNHMIFIEYASSGADSGGWGLSRHLP